MTGNMIESKTYLISSFFLENKKIIIITFLKTTIYNQKSTKEILLNERRDKKELEL